MAQGMEGVWVIAACSIRGRGRAGVPGVTYGMSAGVAASCTSKGEGMVEDEDDDGVRERAGLLGLAAW